jgi:hypothetical protein
MSFSLALLQKALIGRHAKQDFPRLGGPVFPRIRDRPALGNHISTHNN